MLFIRFYCHVLFHFHDYTQISLPILLIENLSGFQFGDITSNVDIAVIIHVLGIQKHSLKMDTQESKIALESYVKSPFSSLKHSFTLLAHTDTSLRKF